MMTARRKWTHSLFALALLALFLSAGTIVNAKGKPPKDDPPPPDISYSITLLGTLGGAWSQATATNELGDVVGYSKMADGTEEAFVYFSDTATMHLLRDLITPIDQKDWRWTEGNPRGINSQGQICMGLSTAVGVPRASHAVRVSLAFDGDGNVLPFQGIVEIVAPSPSSGLDINELGDVTGSHGFYSHAFVYTDLFGFEDGFEDIGDLGGGTAGVDAINLRGEVTGMSAKADGELRAYRFTPEFGMQDLGIISTAGRSYEDRSWGHDVNDKGVVVGSAAAGKRKGWPVTHAFREAGQGQGMEDLGTLGGNNSRAIGINSSGTIIGQSDDKDNRRRLFLYTDKFGMMDLESLITEFPADTLSIEIAQINDAGAICGKIWFDDGPQEPQAYLLRPNP